MNYNDIKKSELTWEINQKLIPVTQIDFSDESIELFNSIINECNSKNYNTIVRTNRGSFSYSKTICPAYDVRATRSLIELTCCTETECFRLQVRTVNKNETNNEDLSGWKSFRKFYNICKEFNINLDDYTVDNGAEIKNNIEPYIIDFGPETEVNKIYKDAHHLDFHSSFPSGLVNTHSEFRPVIEKLYNGRKEHPEYKYILNSTIGYMQSLSCCKAKWANLAKDAINDNNKRIRELAERLTNAGCKILAYNTDGIWYQGEIFHGEGEGKHICEWENDHFDCTIRFKSKGAYEYFEGDKYTPVIRGRTLLDDIKPRSEWVWGDIYGENSLIKKIVLNDDNTLSTCYKGE